jgi:hypothetical protein
VTVDDGPGDLDELSVSVAGLRTQQLEYLFLSDGVAFHAAASLASTEKLSLLLPT